MRRPTMGTLEWPPAPARRLHRPFWRSQRHHSLKWCLNFELAKPRKSSSDPSFGSRKCYCLENMVKVRGREKAAGTKSVIPVSKMLCVSKIWLRPRKTYGFPICMFGPQSPGSLVSLPIEYQMRCDMHGLKKGRESNISKFQH